MATALIGHTGFVGSMLCRTESFDLHYNSSNIEAIAGQSFDRIVCAGVSAVKWWANKNPEEDMHRIQILMDHLANVACERFTLISTIDVYGQPVGMTEEDDPYFPGLHAYGKNRLVLERFVRERFVRCHIVRLPGLFGPGLKKNVIYDMMNRNQIEVINPDSRFQWYPVPRLGADLAKVEGAGIDLVNIVTEPVATRDIQSRFFPDLAIGGAAGPTLVYDNRTIHSTVLGGPGPYHLSADEVMTDLAAYLEGARS